MDKKKFSSRKINKIATALFLARTFQCHADYVTCKIHAQLGNQLFEIAQAMSYAMDHNLPCSFPEVEQAINGSLNHRHIFPKVNTDPLPEGLNFYYYYPEGPELASPFTYIPIENQHRPVCFHGIFQNIHYFEKYTEFFKDLFGLTPEVEQALRVQYAHLFKRPTVAIHVRTFFTDHSGSGTGYLKDLRAGNWDYYLNALDEFPDDYQFIVFSDAYYWTKRNFPRVKPHIYFVPSTNPHYHDFQLISLCDHQVTSYQSTFSWWAAWLNRNPNKKVIYPPPTTNAEGRFPSDWIEKSNTRERQ